QAVAGQTPVISGGVKLQLTWRPYKGEMLQATIPAGLATDQLFVNGQRQHMARYPNYDANQRIFNGYAADAISHERAARWADPNGGYIHAMHSHMWGDFHYRITGKDAKGDVTYEGGWQNNRRMGMHKTYRFVENIFEELDAPGEWYCDAKTSTLYFWPPAGVDMSKALVEAVRLRGLIELRGSAETPIRNVTFRGITFRHAARTFMDNKEPLLRSDWTCYRGGAFFMEGAADSSLEDCTFDQVGGNAVFASGYNRGLIVRGCLIAEAGANGVAFIGTPDAVRNPLFEAGQHQALKDIDRRPGPKSPNYPAECLVEDCLIYRSGRVEKQTAPVQIAMSESITVSHCSLYDVPRAGINIGDGCWGGHVIEFCDIFDTVKETGDHGSFNSWGRDRFWGLDGLNLNDDKTWEAEKDTVRLDAVKTTVMRNNRWRCDHGWDIDLDDGSSNFEIRNNLCLNGGLKNREGFHRLVENNENNIMVNNGFHPHVWYKHSEDVVRRNIMWTDHYLPAGGMPSTPWGKEMDANLVHRAGMAEPRASTPIC
ncbi:MAG: right-handed parallel beta-helix repeat-containing protein, partial [Planctomycetota bacterium]|nr:right-handed parallel beta-helix repeat-containing protein [Planctomycetota bacterium]